MSDLIAVHIAHLRAGGYAKTTRDSRQRLLAVADDWLPNGLDEAHPDDLADFLGYEQWSRWTRSTYWSHLAGYYEWAVRQGRLNWNPLDRLIRPPAGEQVPDPVTDDELARALTRSPDNPWRTAVMLAAYAGLRACEIVAIRREDITKDDVRVRNGKGGRDAYVPAHDLLWRYVEPRAPGLLVRVRHGEGTTAHDLTGRQAKHWRRIGMPEVHLHRFRHWYGTSLLRNGVDLRTVQELMRHRSIISTQGYTQVVDGQRRIGIRALPALAIGTQD